MKAIIAGASGLVGRELLCKLAGDSRFEAVTVVARSDQKFENPKINTVLTTFDQLEKIQFPSAEVAFCSLGTTIKKAGTKAAFVLVDHDYVLNFAKACFKAGVQTFIVVSALGADAHSRIFYNEVKGRTEEDLKKIGFHNLFIIQPSLLLGDRSEKRTGERIAQILTKFINPLLIGPLAKSRPVEAERVAQKMLDLAWDAKKMPAGVTVVLNHRI